VKVFVQDPEVYLSALQIELPGLVHSDRIAILDPEHRSQVNFESYFFSDQSTKTQFNQDLVGRCGILTDPVSRQRFRPGDSSPRVDYAGHPFFFVSEETRMQFERQPELFYPPDVGMIPMIDSTSGGMM
jgi:YHS domain-containing protein